jgi:hypothetical protein
MTERAEHTAGTHCPACNADFDGGPIPENIREHYSPPYRWSRRVGLSDGDRIFAWRCPDCEHQWPRQDARYSITKTNGGVRNVRVG